MTGYQLCEAVVKEIALEGVTGPVKAAKTMGDDEHMSDFDILISNSALEKYI